MVKTATQDSPAPGSGPAGCNDLGVRGRWMAKRRTSRIVTVEGVAIMFTMMWMLAGRWRRRPESRDPTWGVWRLGPFVLAYRFD